ncbi:MULTISPECIES: hypothetical protein [Rhodococcus]|jgi:hypothetical protein|uniref:Possible membrane protein n=1 Tax=Rhodococcus jostii (strain RHA1) TaxID=101510 RepID=Q0SEH9_RHOJR|nr:MULTISPECIES: hypothetical protein [Rhodococcus]ABG94057.1 possible membrane protein [Rhodococcus jostii RHA1]
MIAALETRTALSPLRLALRVDAVVTGANGVAYLAAATVLDDVLGPTAGFLRAIGVFLLVFTAGVWAVSVPDRPSRAAVEAVVVANVVWVGASVALVLTEWQHLTTVGVVWVLLQAVVVGAFAAAQGWAVTRR